MMLGIILNIAAWVGSAFFAFILVKDFIKTEKHYKEMQKNNSKTGDEAHEN